MENPSAPDVEARLAAAAARLKAAAPPPPDGLSATSPAPPDAVLARLRAARDRLDETSESLADARLRIAALQSRLDGVRPAA